MRTISMDDKSRIVKTIFTQVALLILASSGFGESLLAQQRHDFRGSNFGAGHPRGSGLGTIQPGSGNFGTNGPVNYGRSGFGQQYGAPSSPGSSATYSNGRMVAGVTRTPNGVRHLSNGLAYPAIIPDPSIGNAPWMYGNGYGSGGYNLGYYGWNSNPQLSQPLFVDPASGQLVPFCPWGVSGLPFFGGVNPYYPGSILAPTIFSMNISMLPSVPSTASYTMTDPRILDFFGPQPPRVPIKNPQPPDNADQIPFAPGVQVPNHEAPLLNEFDAVPRPEKVSSLSEKINSLRYQSNGDDAFRQEDYAGAEAAYRSAIEAAPDRRSLWIRMTFVQIAREDFAEAVRYLKTGLKMREDATRSWISADELYGFQVAERARSHGGKLWNWLAEQPLSSDRLLLSGTFQKLRGFDAAASELLEMASHEGAEADYVNAVRAIAAADIGQRAISHELDRMVQQTSTKNDSRVNSAVQANARPTLDETSAHGVENDGIFLRGATAQDKTSESSDAPDFVIPKL